MKRSAGRSEGRTRIEGIIQGALNANGLCYISPKQRIHLDVRVRKISVSPDVSSAPAACDATISGDALDPRGRCGSARFRILKVTQSYYPFLERGGPAVKVRALARGLARRGHSVTVLTSDLGIKASMKLPGVIVRTPEGWRFEENGVDTHYLLTRGSYRSLTWNPGILEFRRKQLKVDIVHIYGTYDLLGPSVAGACRQRDIPYVLEPMGMFRPMFRNVALKWLYRRFLGESVVRGAARLVATSLQERRELLEEGIAPEKIIVRRNGIEIPQRSQAPGSFRSQWNIPQETLVVLFLGRIVSKKSPELLLEASARWRRSSLLAQPPMLVLAGPFEDANYRRSLEAQVKRLSLGGAVLFTGPLYEGAKWSALAEADIFVLPSQNENFGNAAAEAVVCGTPVIVTDRCGVATLIEGRAGLVIPHECKALVRALHQLSDPGARERMKLGCAAVARGLGWEQPLAETEALYAELLSGPRAVQLEPVRQESDALKHPELER
jgi:glycosyltransferase involved in cell wall biosynthesis